MKYRAMRLAFTSKDLRNEDNGICAQGCAKRKKTLNTFLIKTEVAGRDACGGRFGTAQRGGIIPVDFH